MRPVFETEANRRERSKQFTPINQPAITRLLEMFLRCNNASVRRQRNFYRSAKLLNDVMSLCQETIILQSSKSSREVSVSVSSRRET